MNTILDIEGVTKEFAPPLDFKALLAFRFKSADPVQALKNISFKLEEGRVMTMLGLNGAGKTTLLKIIATLILPDKGTVSVKGFRLGIDDEKIKSFIGLVLSPERSFYWRLTGKQNLEFFASLYGLDRNTAEQRIAELFKFFEVNYQDKTFFSYSTGMQQKFTLIRAMLHNPQLILLDEPTKSLDYKTAFNLRTLIKEKLIKEQKKTVIFTTHNMEEAMAFGDIFMILHKGMLIALGGLEELRKRIDDPRANLSEIFLKLTA